jgi:hypothetical protein
MTDKDKFFFVDSDVWHVVLDKACNLEGNRYIQRTYHKLVGKDDFSELKVTLKEGKKEPNVKCFTPWFFTVVETNLNKDTGMYVDTEHIKARFFGAYNTQEYMKERGLELPFYVDGDIVPREGVKYEQHGHKLFVVTDDKVETPSQRNVNVPSEEFDATIGLDVYAGDKDQVVIPAPERQDLPEHEPVVENIIPIHNSQELLEEFIRNEEESKEDVSEGLFHAEELTQDDFAEDVGPVIFNVCDEVVISREKYPNSNAFKVEVKYPWDLAHAKRNTDGKISLEEFEKVPTYTYFESSVDNSYIGDLEFLSFLEGKGISYVMSYGGNRVASIGFSTFENKWYGWSHRAMYGFGIGDEVHEGDLTNMSGYTDEYLSEHPEADLSLSIGFKAMNLQDAKRMAIAFADAVS